MQLNSCAHHRGKSMSPSSFFSRASNRKRLKKFRRKDISQSHVLSGIAQALIEHADLAFSLSPNNHHDIKCETKMAPLHMKRIPSSRWVRRVYLYIYLSASLCVSRLWVHADASIHGAHMSGRAGCRAAEGRLVSFFSPSLPVSNQDKSSASEEVLPF